MLEIKKIKKISLANALSFFCFIAVFVAVVSFYAYALIAALKTGQTAEPISNFIWFNIGVAFLSGLFAAFWGGLISWLIGFCFAGLYNLFAKYSQGLKVEIEGICEVAPEKENVPEKLFPF